MNPNPPIVIRPLNSIEQAFTLSNSTHPLCAVIVINIEPAPDPERLRSVAIEVQKRHILLQAGISVVKGDYVFTKLTSQVSIPLEVHRKQEANSWRVLAEKALNTSFPEAGPLMRIDYVCDPRQRSAEIIMTFHHAIIDGNSARLILHEVLSLLGDLELPAQQPWDETQPGIAIRPKNRSRSLFRFLRQQVPEEWLYRKKGLFVRPATHSENKIAFMRLSVGKTKKLQKFCGRKRLNLNNLILGALTMAILRNKYPNKKSGLVRVINFANVGSSLKPPIRPEDLGCYISMLRLTIPFHEESNVTSIATDIRKALFALGRTDTIKLMAWLSKYLVKMTLRLKNTRMGVSALSFIGALDLSPKYGVIELLDVKAFISNNQYGPEFSGFGKILHNMLGLDLNYLTAETSEEQASRIIADLENILYEVANIS